VERVKQAKRFVRSGCFATAAADGVQAQQRVGKFVLLSVQLVVLGRVVWITGQGGESFDLRTLSVDGTTAACCARPGCECLSAFAHGCEESQLRGGMPVFEAFTIMSCWHS